MTTKQALYMLSNTNNEYNILMALDVLEKRAVAEAIETIMDFDYFSSRMGALAKLMQEHNDRFSKIYSALGALTAYSFGYTEPYPCGPRFDFLGYVVSDNFDLEVGRYFIKKRNHNLSFIDESYEPLELYDLEYYHVLEVLENLLPIKEEIHVIEFYNVKIEAIPAIILEEYTHIKAIHLIDCAYPKDLTHEKIVFKDYQEEDDKEAYRLPRHYYWLFRYMIDDIKKSEETVTQKLNVKGFFTNNDQTFEALESIENFPKSIVKFYDTMKGFQFWWHGLHDELDSSVFKSHINFLSLDDALKQPFFKNWTQNDFDFGGENWSIDGKLLNITGDFDFYPLEILADNCGVGYFTGSRCDDYIYYFKYKSIYSMNLNLDGYLLFLSKTYGVSHWQEVIVDMRSGGIFSLLESFYLLFEPFVKMVDKNFRIWALKELYFRVKGKQKDLGVSNYVNFRNINTSLALKIISENKTESDTLMALTFFENNNVALGVKTITNFDNSSNRTGELTRLMQANKSRFVKILNALDTYNSVNAEPAPYGENFENFKISQSSFKEFVNELHGLYDKGIIRTQKLNVEDFYERNEKKFYDFNPNKVPTSILEFYRKMMKFEFWWCSLDEEFKPNSEESYINILSFDEGFEQALFSDLTFMDSENWTMDGKPLEITGDFDFYPLEIFPKNNYGVGYFTGSRRDDQIYYFKRKKIWSMDITIDGYLLLLFKIYGLSFWQELIVDINHNRPSILNTKGFGWAIKPINKDFTIKGFKELYHSVKKMQIT